MTTRDQIREWLERGKLRQATHMIVAVDTFDYGNYPVFVSSDEDVRDVEAKTKAQEMTRVMEVYNLSMDWEEQIDQQRSFNY